MEELLKSLRLMYAKQEEEKDERKRKHDATGCFVERIGGCSCWDYAISGETSVGIAQKANPMCFSGVRVLVSSLQFKATVQVPQECM